MAELENMIIAKPGQLPGRIELTGSVDSPLALMGAAGYLLMEMKKQGLKKISVRLEDYDSGNLTPDYKPLILQKGIITIPEKDELLIALNKLIWKLPKGSEKLSSLIETELADEGIDVQWSEEGSFERCSRDFEREAIEY
jgi:hypothetical protein